MEIIVPFEIDDTNLVSSSVAEDDAEMWCAFKTYIAGQKVLSKKNHYIYEALKDVTDVGFNQQDISSIIPVIDGYSTSFIESITVYHTKSAKSIFIYKDPIGDVYGLVISKGVSAYYFDSPIFLFHGNGISWQGTLNAFYINNKQQILITELSLSDKIPSYCLISVTSLGVISITKELTPISEDLLNAEYLRSVWLTSMDCLVIAHGRSDGNIYLKTVTLDSSNDTMIHDTVEIGYTNAMIDLCSDEISSSLYIVYTLSGNSYVDRLLINSAYSLSVSYSYTLGVLYSKLTTSFSITDNVLCIFYVSSITSKLHLIVLSCVSDFILVSNTLLVNSTIDGYYIKSLYYDGKVSLLYKIYVSGQYPCYFQAFSDLSKTLFVRYPIISSSATDYRVNFIDYVFNGTNGQPEILYSCTKDSIAYTFLAYSKQASPQYATSDYMTEPYWVEVSPSNRYAMFDAEVNTSTTALDEIAVEVHPSETATGISFFNLVGDNLNITVTDSTDTEVYNVDISLDGTIIATPWDWWFRTFRQKQTYVNSEFPPFYNSTIKVTLTGSGEVAIGAMQVGKSEYIGTALQGTGFGCDDYSIVERVFAKTKFKKKGNAQLTNIELFVEGWRMPTTVQVLRSTLSTPATFVPTGDDLYPFMSTLGYHQTYNATIEIDGKISIEIRELS